MEKNFLLQLQQKYQLLIIWIGQKFKLHRSVKLQYFKEGEVWWMACGENIGVEINGKSEKFSRPFAILKKYSRFGFMAVPQTSQPHEGSWYVSFQFQRKTSCAALSQARSMSAKRLYCRMGELDEEDFRKIKKQFLELHS